MVIQQGLNKARYRHRVHTCTWDFLLEAFFSAVWWLRYWSSCLPVFPLTCREVWLSNNLSNLARFFSNSACSFHAHMMHGWGIINISINCRLNYMHHQSSKTGIADSYLQTNCPLIWTEVFPTHTKILSFP